MSRVKLLRIMFMKLKNAEYAKYRKSFLDYTLAIHNEIKGNVKAVVDIGCGKG